MLWKYFQNCIYNFRENWEINLTICHTVPHFKAYLFTLSVKSTVPVLFWDYVADCWWLRVMVSICLVRKGKCNWFLDAGLLLDWLIFVLYLLQSVYCSQYSAKTTNFSTLNLFLHFLHLLVLKYFRIFSNFTAFESFLRCELRKELY